MTPAKAMTEIFITAFKALPHAEQESFMAKLIKDKHFKEDLIDLAIAEIRKHEKTKPLHKVITEMKAGRN